MNTETKFTPGPWTVDGIGDDNAGQPALVVCANHTGYVCGIHLAPDAVFTPEDHANTALIAAAPEMFEALKDLMRCFVGDRNAQNCVGESGIVADKARAALAKASGRERGEG